MKNKSIFFFSFSLILLIFSCKDHENLLVPPAPNYAQPSAWFGNPKEENKHDIDIFYIYPSIIFTSVNESGDTLYYFDIENDKHRELAQNIQRQYQVIYADTLYNFYAPLYRQAALETFNESEDFIRNKMEIPIADIKNAFDYYIENYNNGRPFYLMGHSQGALLIIDLLKKSLTDEQLQRMVAAYAFGYQITDDELASYPSRLIPAKDSSDVHCVVLFNCIADTNATFPLSRHTAVGINPLNWKTDATFAQKSRHQGFAQYDPQNEVCSYLPNYTDAYLWNHFLVCPDVDPNIVYNEKIKKLCPYGNLHLLDPLLFAKDIKMNMLCRERTFH